MADSSPYEVIWGPCELWIATSNTARPNLGAVVSGGGWALLGLNGNMNIANGSVAFSSEQTFAEYTPLGVTGITKAKRATEAVHLTATLNDMTVETLAKALNNNAITTTAAGAGTVGKKAVNLYAGNDVADFAILLRFDKSAYGATSGFTTVWRSQIWLPKAYQSTGVAPAFNRDGDPAGLTFDWKSLYDLTNGFGVYEAVHAGATS